MVQSQIHPPRKLLQRRLPESAPAPFSVCELPLPLPCLTLFLRQSGCSRYCITGPRRFNDVFTKTRYAIVGYCRSVNRSRQIVRHGNLKIFAGGPRQYRLCPRSSDALATACRARRAIHEPLPSSPATGPQPPAKTCFPCRLAPTQIDPVPEITTIPGAPSVAPYKAMSPS